MLIPLESAEGVLVTATIREIAEGKRTEKAVEAAPATSKAQLRELADQKFALDQHAIVAVTDVQGTITYVNEKFCVISQYSKDELIGQNHHILNSGYHSKEFFQQMYHTIANGKVWHGEIKNRAKDGSIYWRFASAIASHQRVHKDHGGEIWPVAAGRSTAEPATHRAGVEQDGPIGG